LESDRLPDWLQRMKYNSEYQYILMLLESVKPRVYGWTLTRAYKNDIGTIRKDASISSLSEAI
ncbi:hypothetical protein, partial [Thiolapillus sp.]|uniref:hypothetical protein n=1 Tax=Thiolapillus sp. TaxID=2017437 RepID=UPI003AF50338